jgi:hypothetical protein
MTPHARKVLHAIQAAGGEVNLASEGRLKLTADHPLPDALVEQVRAAKDELLAALAENERQRAADDQVDDEERAAILEHDGGLPRAWADLLAHLRPAYPPPNLSPNDWVRYVDAVHILADEWAGHMARLGWRPEAVLGWGGRGLFPYTARGSLPWLLSVGQYTLLRLDEEKAVARTPGGARRVLRRVHGQLHTWRADS